MNPQTIFVLDPTTTSRNQVAPNEMTSTVNSETNQIESKSEVFTKTQNQVDKKQQKSFRVLFGLKTYLIFAIIFAFVSIIVATYFILLMAFVPCRFKTCHKNATCINQYFYAKCKCLSGFNGNGIECDECGLSYPGESQHEDMYLYYSSDSDHLTQPFTFPATVKINFRYNRFVKVNDRIYRPGIYKICFGILVNRRTILTAANCIPKNITFKPYDFRGDGFTTSNRSLTVPVTFTDTFPDWQSICQVFVGLYKDIYYGDEITPTQRLAIKDIIIHEKYKDESLDYDLAIIKLLYSVELSNTVQLACLPDETDLPYMNNYVQYNASAVTLGWNIYINSSGYFEWLFTDFYMNIFDLHNCSILFPNTPELDQLICAGKYAYLPIGPKDIYPNYCNGYPGSPLNVNKTYYGVTKTLSLGISLNNTICGISAFANLFYFIDWIAEKSDY